MLIYIELLFNVFNAQYVLTESILQCIHTYNFQQWHTAAHDHTNTWKKEVRSMTTYD